MKMNKISTPHWIRTNDLSVEINFRKDYTIKT